ncbi:MAG: NAD-glutamate dehydrogenase [Hyphomicrobiaceae bacterium]|nr:NAD-glutamate dehydrogenase [Hyphomicrobiaceae bacterium]
MQDLDKLASERIAAAAALLSGDRDGQSLERLLLDLTEQGLAEDLAAYDAGDLAWLVRDLWVSLQSRLPGPAQVRVFNPGGDGRLGTVTVIEIVNDNMPFLVDSALGELTEAGLDIRLVLHPILALDRDPDGRLAAFRGRLRANAAAPGSPESVIHIHIARIDAETERAALADKLRATFADVRVAVRDWRAMLGRLEETIVELRANPPPIPVEETAETIQFLRWLAEDNFTLLGMRDYEYQGDAETGELVRTPETGLGLLENPDHRILRRGNELVQTTPEVRAFMASAAPIVITKASVRSRVHRRVHMDYVGVKRYDANGKVLGERRIIGLFTATAYTRSTKTIPVVRHKVDNVIVRAGFDPKSHSGKALMNVLEHYPRDELFQIDEATLFAFATRIMALDEHPRLRVLARRDAFDRFVSVLVYVPRDRYNSEIRVRIGDYLAKAFDGRVSAYYPGFPDGSLARVHFIIGRYHGATPAIADADLEIAIGDIVRTWADGLREELTRRFDATRAGLYLARYRSTFSAAYREAYSIAEAVTDIAVLERLTPDRPLAIDFHRPADMDAHQLALKLFRLDAPIPLSDRVPVLENLGLRVVEERTYELATHAGRVVYLHDMALASRDGRPFDLTEEVDTRLEAFFLAVWTGAAENDGFNALGLAAGLGWRDVALLRAMARYLRQVGMSFSLDYVWGTLNRHAGLARHLVDLYAARFDPDLAVADRTLNEERIVHDLESALEAVTVLDEDRILRRFINLITATLRVNTYQLGADGRPREVFAFKIDSQRIIDLPEPKPYREIWVYSPRVEGVHLRFGKVARGGLRWSDRPQDFRTEVLGLVKAQQVKNAVIVPMGAKGGFFPKRLPPASSREAWLAEGTEAYKLFVSSLLTVTDNLVGDAVVPPERVVRHEGDDPYLVVAADKGTATFSDTANAIAAAHKFWLDDAFASGGSVGYDHKKMAITARGAWEAVKRHFREIDRDIQTTPVIVAGVGDMSGDVFGNGMLLSRQIRLVAAFDHRDIFIDPTPDPETSFNERARLFSLPRSSWRDYDASLISEGGGVFGRDLKAIALSPPMQDLLELRQPKATPQEVMHAILKMPVDLMWFGGIGTYIRASDETDAQVGDRANDAIRVNAREVRAKVIGEGANLGVTQRARIEFNRQGGRCNTDAIDNSAGVNSSDVEVNIKIALGKVVAAGGLTLPQRNKLLVDMTEEVGGLVLRNNYQQTLAISLIDRRGVAELGFQRRFMQVAEKAGKLSRAVEYLPDDTALAAREKAGQGLARAEICVLLAYAKLILKEQLLATDVVDDPYLGRELNRYFPTRMRDAHRAAIETHRLRREIVATGLSNSIINRGGPTFVTRVADQTGADAATIARAFASARDVFGTTTLNDEIDRLDNRIGGALQLRLYAAVQDLMLETVVWFVRNVGFDAGLQAIIDRFRPGTEEIGAEMAALMPVALAEPAARDAAELIAAGVPEPLARRLAFLPFEAAVPDIVLVAERTGKRVAEAAGAWFAMAERFRIGRLDAAARAIKLGDYYESLALDRARGILAEAHRGLAAEALGHLRGQDGWLADHARAVERTLAAVADITGSGALTVARFTVAAGLIEDLADA